MREGILFLLADVKPRYERVTSKGYPALGTCTTLQYHFYNATCPHRCIHESLLVLYQLGNYYGRYTNLHIPAISLYHIPPRILYATHLVDSPGATTRIPCALLPPSRLIASPVTCNPSPLRYRRALQKKHHDTVCNPPFLRNNKNKRCSGRDLNRPSLSLF